MTLREFINQNSGLRITLLRLENGMTHRVPSTETDSENGELLDNSEVKATLRCGNASFLVYIEEKQADPNLPLIEQVCMF